MKEIDSSKITNEVDDFYMACLNADDSPESDIEKGNAF